MAQVKGAYALLILTRDAIYAVRDRYGFRPLTLGRLGESWIVASETCALDLMEARTERDVEPGELVVISDAGLHSYRAAPAGERLQCVFEYVYFARPDSILWGQNVHTVRKELAPARPRAPGRGRSLSRCRLRTSAALATPRVGHAVRPRAHPQPLRRRTSSSPSRGSATSA